VRINVQSLACFVPALLASANLGRPVKLPITRVNYTSQDAKQEHRPSAFSSIRPLDLLVSLEFGPAQYLVTDRRFMDCKNCESRVTGTGTDH
jgi:hypothetical protein